MNNESIVLAYCQENRSAALQIEDRLSAGGVRFEHAFGSDNLEDPTLAERLSSTRSPVLLIVSDNFLKSAQCMGQGIELLQKRSGQILPVVIDGTEVDPETGETKATRTNFDRVSDIIKYINYWQDQYLDLRRKKRQIEDLDESLYNVRLKKLRDISSEVGEFLRLLRSMDHVRVEQLAANDYERFFRFIDDTAAWQRFKSAAPEALATEEPVVVTEELSITPTEAPEEPTAPENLIDPTPVQPEETPEPDLAATQPKEETEEEQVPEPKPEPEVVEEPPKSTVELVKEGLEHFEAGHIEEAFIVMGQAVEQDPDNPNLRYHYALMLYKDNRDVSAAVDQLKKVVDIQPDNVDALMMLAKIAEQQQDYAMARWNYEKVLEIDPAHNNTSAAYRYAQLLAESGTDQARAIEYFKKVITLRPNHPKAYFDIADLYRQLGDLDQAREYYRQAVGVNPQMADDSFEALLYPDPTPAPAPKPAETVTAPENLLQAEIENEEKTIQLIKHNLLRLEELLKNKKAEQEKLLEEEEEISEPPSPPVKEEVIFISGATAGIGRATAEKFASESYRLILNGRRQDRLEELKNHLEATYNTEVRVLAFDVRDNQAAGAAFSSLEDEWKTIDVLVNNAGKARGLAPIHEGELDHWEEMIDTNVKGLLYLTRLISPQMVSRKAGHIINVGSIAGKEVYPSGNVYSATKFAVDALTRSMVIDLHRHNIKVSQVSPGMVEETEFAMVRFDGDEDKARIYEDFNPLTAADVAETIYFIASAPAHVNIQDVVMTGTQQANSVFIDRSGRSTEEEQ